MNKERKIQIVLSSGEPTECVVCYTDSPPWKMSVDCGKNGIFNSEAEDLFEAFVNIRKQLHNSGIDLLCNGSRRNIYPSPMLRQSGGGVMAYLLRLGVPARREDIVSIFDPIKKDKIDSIEKQKEFYQLWLDTLKPTSKEIKEASNNPSGWVYRIDGHFSDNEYIPPTAIIGSWQVDSDGMITNNFVVNKKYKPEDDLNN